MNNIREEDAGRGRGYCPSLLYPLRLGSSCKVANRRLSDALPRVNALNRTGWKVTTNSVAASRFGQQKVSSRGEAMADRRRQKEREKGGEKRKREEEVGYGVKAEKEKDERERKCLGT